MAKRGDCAKAVVAHVCHVQIASGCQCEAIGVFKGGGSVCAISPRATPTACKCRHCSIGKDESYDIVAAISHEDPPAAIHCHTPRGVKRDGGGAHAIGKGGGAPSASQGGHSARGGDFTDALITRVCNVHYPQGIHCKARGVAEACKGPHTISPSADATSS
jgi:hypothetical protein